MGFIGWVLDGALTGEPIVLHFSQILIEVESKWTVFSNTFVFAVACNSGCW